VTRWDDGRGVGSRDTTPAVVVVVPGWWLAGQGRIRRVVTGDQTALLLPSEGTPANRVVGPSQLKWQRNR